MTPEQRVAQRAMAKHGLTVPVDVDALARAIADIEEDRLPVNSDAVVITTGSGRERPLIILNRDRPPTRRRFTLAHEVGHLLIPWHMGTIACSTNGSIRFGDRLYRMTEAEANRFASELLTPISWLKEVVDSGLSAGELHKFVRSTANVSTVAAAIALSQALPPGHLFAVLDEKNLVQYSSTSLMSSISGPTPGELLNVEAYSRHANLHEVVYGGSGQNVHWWSYGAVSALSARSDTRTANEILKSIVSSTVTNQDHAKKITQSISGIVGSVNSGIQTANVEEFLGVLHQRFIHRIGLEAIMSHPDFETFLAKKATDLVQRKRMQNSDGL